MFQRSLKLLIYGLRSSSFYLNTLSLSYVAALFLLFFSSPSSSYLIAQAEPRVLCLVCEYLPHLDFAEFVVEPAVSIILHHVFVAKHLRSEPGVKLPDRGGAEHLLQVPHLVVVKVLLGLLDRVDQGHCQVSVEHPVMS